MKKKKEEEKKRRRERGKERKERGWTKKKGGAYKRGNVETEEIHSVRVPSRVYNFAADARRPGENHSEIAFHS